MSEKSNFDYVMIFEEKINTIFTEKSTFEENSLENIFLAVEEWFQFYQIKIITNSVQNERLFNSKVLFLFRACNDFIQKEHIFKDLKEIIKKDINNLSNYQSAKNIIDLIFNFEDKIIETYRIYSKSSHFKLKYSEFLQETYLIFLKEKLFQYIRKSINKITSKSQLSSLNRHYSSKDNKGIQTIEHPLFLKEQRPSKKIELAFEEVMTENQNLKSVVIDLENKLNLIKSQHSSSILTNDQKITAEKQKYDEISSKLKKDKEMEIYQIKYSFQAEMDNIKKKLETVQNQTQKQKKMQKLFYEKIITDLKITLKEQFLVIKRLEDEKKQSYEILESKKLDEVFSQKRISDLTNKLHDIKQKYIEESVDNVSHRIRQTIEQHGELKSERYLRKSKFWSQFFQNSSKSKSDLIPVNLQALIPKKKQINGRIFDAILDKIETLRTEKTNVQKNSALFVTENSIYPMNESEMQSWENRSSKSVKIRHLEEEISTIKFIVSKRSSIQNGQSSRFLQNIQKF